MRAFRAFTLNQPTPIAQCSYLDIYSSHFYSSVESSKGCVRVVKGLLSDVDCQSTAKFWADDTTFCSRLRV